VYLMLAYKDDIFTVHMCILC